MQNFLSRFEVAVGIAAGDTSVRDYADVGTLSPAVIKNLYLPSNSIIFVSLRAINNANLYSSVVSDSILISQIAKLEVLDGLDQQDTDYSNDPSSFNGQIRLSSICPIKLQQWAIFDLFNNFITNFTDFYGTRFANDELELLNRHSYYSVVRIIDNHNRTLTAKSNGVTINIQPPVPGAVREGKTEGEDVNYQESVKELSANWDMFGAVDGELEVVWYEIAIGTDPSHSSTRSDVYAFTNVALNRTHTFTKLSLTAKTVKYYVTVKAHSRNGASVESTSNGVYVGFKQAMTAGYVNVQKYFNTSTLSFSWFDFFSDFTIVDYIWVLSMNSSQSYSDTQLCVYFSETHNMVAYGHTGTNTYITTPSLALQHGSTYYLSIIAADEAGQCIQSVPVDVTFDLTPPTAGKVIVNGMGDKSTYVTSDTQFHVSWINVTDNESAIRFTFIQLLYTEKCGSINSTTNVKYYELSNEIDVSNASDYIFRGLNVGGHSVYKVKLREINGAGTELIVYSEPIFIDTTAAVTGTVRDGSNWTSQTLFQLSTSEMRATIALRSPGYTKQCLHTYSILNKDSFSDDWYVFDNIWRTKNTDGENMPSLLYKEKDVQWEENGLQIHFHYNISLSILQGGFMQSRIIEIINGRYEFYLSAAAGLNVITSVSISSEPFQEPIDFILPQPENKQTDEDFIKDANHENIEWQDPVGGTTKVYVETTPLTNVALTTISADYDNETVSDYNATRAYIVPALGFQILGFSVSNTTEEWYLMMWVKSDNGYTEQWLRLNKDPTLAPGMLYTIELVKEQSYGGDIWKLKLFVNSELMTSISGIVPPTENATIFIRNWSYEDYIPVLSDPFAPFYSITSIQQVNVAMKQEFPCHFANLFEEPESGYRDIYVGISNDTSLWANIRSFQLFSSVCNPCDNYCDYNQCEKSCHWDTVDNTRLISLLITGLTLIPGEEKFELSFDSAPNTTYFDPKVYFFDVMIVNDAGFITRSKSSGIRIDQTSPTVVQIWALDPVTKIPAVAQSVNSSLAAFWEFEERDGQLVEYSVAAGTEPGKSDIFPWTSVGLQTTIVLQNLTELLQVNKTYFVTVNATNYVGLIRTASHTGITVTDYPLEVGNATSNVLNGSCGTYGSGPVCFSSVQDYIGLIVSDFDSTRSVGYGKSFGNRICQIRTFKPVIQ